MKGYNDNLINMKTLGKLNINPEKIMKPEELVALKGSGTCWCYDCSSYGIYLGPDNFGECLWACFEIGCSAHWEY